MFSNERPSPYGQQSYRPPVPEDTLKSVEFQIERKFFVITLKENAKGRFLRISEDVAGRRNTIIIPSTGLADFQKLLHDMVRAAEASPAPKKKRPVDVVPDEDAFGNR